MSGSFSTRFHSDHVGTVTSRSVVTKIELLYTFQGRASEIVDIVFGGIRIDDLALISKMI